MAVWSRRGVPWPGRLAHSYGIRGRMWAQRAACALHALCGMQMVRLKTSWAWVAFGAAALLAVTACGGSSKSDPGAGGGSGGGSSGTGGSGATAANGGGGGNVPCTSIVPCCDASGNSVDPVCDSNGMPQCPSGTQFPTSGTCTASSCTSQSGCSSNEFCDFPDDLCGKGQPGSCKPRPNGCDLIYDPVCTCTGKIAGNACAANAGGQDVRAGGCTAPTGFFECGAKFCAEGSQYCIHEISDVGGIPDSFACGTFSPACVAGAPCECLKAMPCGEFCSVDAGGNTKLTCPGG